MKCENCGNSIRGAGYKDKNGKELWVDDIVWIEWKSDGYLVPLCAIGRIVFYSDSGGLSVEIEPGGIRINGEVADHIQQKTHVMNRPISYAQEYTFLYRPKSKVATASNTRLVTTTTTKDEFGHTHTDVS